MPKADCGSPGTAPSSSRFTSWIEVEKSEPSTGPKTPTGLTTESSRPEPSAAMKSQAARSESVFDFA